MIQTEQTQRVGFFFPDKWIFLAFINYEFIQASTGCKFFPTQFPWGHFVHQMTCMYHLLGVTSLCSHHVAVCVARGMHCHAYENVLEKRVNPSTVYSFWHIQFKGVNILLILYELSKFEGLFRSIIRDERRVLGKPFLEVSMGGDCTST